MFREDGTALHETRPSLPLEGEWTLAGFCEHLATLELWPEPPEWDGALRFRRWAFESAALDLALRQAGHSLHDVLGLGPEPVRFVNSLGLGKEPSIEPLRQAICCGAVEGALLTTRPHLSGGPDASAWLSKFLMSVLCPRVGA